MTLLTENLDAATAVGPGKLPAHTPSEALRHGIIYTEVSPATAWFLIISFLLILTIVPLLQLAVEVWGGRRPQALELFDQAPVKKNLKRWEENLDRSSVARRFFQPRVQEWLSAPGGFGNTSVVVGRDGWLYFRPGVDSLTGRGILLPPPANIRGLGFTEGTDTPRHWDPRPALLEFHRQCAAIGAHLIILPIPDKAALQPAHLTHRLASVTALPTNRDYDRLIADLRQAGLDVFDPTPPQLSPDKPLFLIQDTHWTPQWLRQVATDLAAHIQQSQLLPTSTPTNYTIHPREISRVGDLVDNLQLSPNQHSFPPQTVTIDQVLDARTSQFWRPTADAPVLLLGDSFTNIYSADAMGWGESAGFAEHLSQQLKCPLNRIARNDAGAYATRQTLANMRARGKDLLAGTRIVIWEFAARELALGDWKPIDMKLGRSAPASFVSLKPGQVVTATATIDAIAPAVRPGTVPYKDHVIALHLVDIQSPSLARLGGGHALVYMYGMRDNVPAPAARYLPEQRVTLRLRPWTDVSGKLDAINRAELNDDELNLAEPLWAEEAMP